MKCSKHVPEQVQPSTVLLMQGTKGPRTELMLESFAPLCLGKPRGRLEVEEAAIAAQSALANLFSKLL